MTFKKYKVRKNIDTTKYETAEDISRELTDAIGKSEDEFLQTLREAVISTKGMYQVSREIHCSAPSLYKSLKKGGKPQFSTIWNVINALGVTVELEKYQEKE